MRKEIKFLRRGQVVQLGDTAPTLTLLDYLRLTEHAVGTKEGKTPVTCVTTAARIARPGAGFP
jgi:xanthine dehydrogenase iron-sulfur cluster and FAD-binding subunit A